MTDKATTRNIHATQQLPRYDTREEISLESHDRGARLGETCCELGNDISSDEEDHKSCSILINSCEESQVEQCALLTVI
jgi:hypothetical protein